GTQRNPERPLLHEARAVHSYQVNPQSIECNINIEYVSKKEETARLMRKSLEDNAPERNTNISMALDALTDAGNASDKEVLDKTREIVRHTFWGEVGAKLAIDIVSGVRLEHINEYNDRTRQARANPPSQYSSSSSSSAGPFRLGKQAVIDAALKEEKWRLEPALN
ncbi:MAG: hypothetical protein ACKPKO_18325, partial [Candidatus Fonsibacter sp.]